MLVPRIMSNDLFSDFMRDFSSDSVMSPAKSDLMRTDVKETEDSYILEMDLPGYSKADVQASLEDGYLTITATKNSSNEEKDKDGKYIRRERFYGNCSRSFYVGDAVTDEDINAKFDNGILYMKVKKAEAKEIEKKQFIQIEG